MQHGGGWSIFGDWRDLRVVRALGASEPDRRRALAASVAAWELRGPLAHIAHGQLVDMAEAAGVHVGWTGRHDEAALRERVVQAVLDVRLLVVAIDRVAVAPPPPPAPARVVEEVAFDAVAPAPPPALDWISFTVEDEQGLPVAGKPYEVVTADGNVRRGRTGANGLVSLTGIPPGQCRFSLVEHDAYAWDRA